MFDAKWTKVAMTQWWIQDFPEEASTPEGESQSII